MPYTPEELQALKELRKKNKERYQHEYYLKYTKPKRQWKTTPPHSPDFLQKTK